jgi:hypothetical protein
MRFCRVLVVSAVAGLVFFACSDKTTAPVDGTPPAAVANLSWAKQTADSVLLGWNAPGDDGMKGRAQQYDLRHYGRTITEANWDSAVVVSGVPSQEAAGEVESFWMGGVDSGAASLFFAVKTKDDAGNWSALSNCASVENRLYSGIVWTKALDGTGHVKATDVLVDPEGSIVVAGRTDGQGAGKYDLFLLKADSAGNIIWQKTYGGSEDEYAVDLVRTSDGGYCIGGWTYSFGAGDCDYYLVRTDKDGNFEWQRTYGGAGGEVATSMAVASDDGFIIGGGSSSWEVSPSLYVVRPDATGEEDWHVCRYVYSPCPGSRPIAQCSDVAGSTGGVVAYAWRFQSQTESPMGGCNMPDGSSGVSVVDKLGIASWDRRRCWDDACTVTYLIGTSDGGFAALMRDWGGSWFPTVFRFDSQGRELWAISDPILGLDDIVQLVDLLSGNLGVLRQVDGNAVVLGIDQAGSILPGSFSFGLPDKAGMVGMAPTGCCSAVIVGNIGSGGEEPGAFAMKVRLPL